MDASRLLFLSVVVISTSELKSETTDSNCKDLDVEIFKILEGESFYFTPLSSDDLTNENFTWYKNGPQIESILPDEKDRIHHHGGALFFLNLLASDSGTYTGRRIKPSGKCYKYHAEIEVHGANKTYPYGSIEVSDRNPKVPCPNPVASPCKLFKGSFTWFKESNLLQGQHEADLFVYNASKKHEGLYTCRCTWTHNHKVYNTSGSRRLKVNEAIVYRHVEILSPTNKEQFADEGVEIKLNCSVFCGTAVKRDCDASWIIDGLPVTQMDGYHQTTKMEIVGPSKNTISTAILAIEKVSAKDFQSVFKCVGVGRFTKNSTTLALKRRESITPLVITGVCVLFFCVFAAVLVKCFAIDLALFFRPYFPLSSHKEDVRLYDAYVVYQTQSMDKVTEDTLSRFVTTILPSVLENKCGYRLFIHGRDDIPGEDRLELVEDCMKQSKRLMVILTPGSESGCDMTSQCPAASQTSAIGGFDWQVGLHHVLVQQEMNVILVQLGDTGPQGYTHLPPGLQHLIRKSAPIRWPEGSRGAAAWNSRFWKRVRYLMPAIPAKKCAQSSIV